jgi:hypothetical protein
MPLQPEALELLSRIARSLENQNGTLPPAMGLIDLPRTQYLYVGREGAKEDTSCWYRRKDEQNVLVHSDGLAGHLIGLESHTTTYKDEDKIKLRILMRCGSQTYCIQSGMSSVFSRGILLGLKEIEDIQLPITIAVRPSKEEEKVVFGSIFLLQQPIKTTWDKNVDCLDLFQFVCRKFNFSTEPQSAQVAKIAPAPRRSTRKDLENDFFQVFTALQRNGVNKEAMQGSAKSLFPDFTTTANMSDEDLEKFITHLTSWNDIFPIHF